MIIYLSRLAQSVCNNENFHKIISKLEIWKKKFFQESLTKTILHACRNGMFRFMTYKSYKIWEKSTFNFWLLRETFRGKKWNCFNSFSHTQHLVLLNFVLRNLMWFSINSWARYSRPIKDLSRHITIRLRINWQKITETFRSGDIGFCSNEWPQLVLCRNRNSIPQQNVHCTVH